MARTAISASRVMNGTWGQLWVSGRLVAEATACQLKSAKSKEEVNLCGSMVPGYKTTKVKNTGSIELYHVDSDFVEQESSILEGLDNYYTIITKLSDPETGKVERVAVYDVNFDDVTLADWKAATVGKKTLPFTFGRYDLLDVAEVE